MVPKKLRLISILATGAIVGRLGFGLLIFPLQAAEPVRKSKQQETTAKPRSKPDLAATAAAVQKTPDDPKPEVLSEKNVDPDPVVAKELQKLTGTWVAISVENKGKKLPMQEVNAGKLILVIQGSDFTLTSGKNPPMKGTLKVDPTKQPKTMDWLGIERADRQLGDLFGIYELNDNFLTFNFAGRRPTEFKTNSGANADRRMYLFKRSK